MRQFTLLLCLLVVAALRSLIGFDEAPATAERNDAVLPKRHIAQEAVNKGCEPHRLRPGLRSADMAWGAHELLLAAIGAGPHSTNTILSRSNQPVRFEFIVIGAAKATGNLPPVPDRA